MKGVYFFLSIYGLGMALFHSSCTPSLDKVSTKGRQIWVNDSPYFIKGICYSPVPKGKEKRDFRSLDNDLALMLEAGN
jgi:hypothetical protein